MKRMRFRLHLIILAAALSAVTGLGIFDLHAACTPPPAGLVSWWPGEGAANDIQGTNHGTLTATGATYVSGKVGQSFRFDGTNGFLQIPDSDSLKPANITCEAWVWLDPNVANPRNEQVFFKRNTWTFYFEDYSLVKIDSDNGNGTYTSRFQCAVSRSGNQVVVDSTTAIQRGVWHHVAMTYDGNTVKLFVNGTQEGSAFAGFPLDHDAQPVCIGSTGIPGNYVNYLAGVIDEPSIYNRALATNEIAAIYNAGTAGKCSSVPPPASLVVNGSFENPPGIYPYQVFDSGNPIPGWVIESGTVEINASTYWQSAEGLQSLDLNGIFDQIGTIYQDLPTLPGQNYKVRFAYAGNPECGLPTLKTANAYWNGLLLTNLSFDITGHTVTNLGWVYYEQIVSATSTNSRIRFQATSPTFCGLTLDDVSVTSTTLPATCTPLAGMVGWWKGDGSAVDVVAGNNGTLINAGYTNGVVGPAFSFDPQNFAYGTYTGVQIADQPAYALTNSLTIEGWVRPRGDSYVIFFRGDHRPGIDPYSLSMNANHELYFNIGDESGNTAGVSSYLNYNQWTHLAATLDGATGALQLYTNGVLAAQTTTSLRPFGALDAGQSPGIGIGNVNDGGNNFPFWGDIDDIALYSRALSVSEIAAIYLAGAAGKCGTPVVTCTPPPTNLVAWLRGEGNLNDSAGINNGTQSGGVTYNAGEVGQGFYFNGSSQIKLTSSASLNVGTSGGLTLETWLRPGRLTLLEPQFVFEWNDGVANNGVHLMLSTDHGVPGDGLGNVLVDVVDTLGNSHGIWTAANVITTNALQHVAFTYDKTSGNAVIYVNGLVAASTNLGSFTPQTSYDLYLGNRASGPFAGSYFNGQLDEPSIYNRALSLSEIQSIYVAGSAGKCVPAIPPVPPTIVAQTPNQVVLLGSPVTFSVTATGTDPLSYFWKRNGALIPNATNAVYTILHSQTTDSGSKFSCLVSNAFGTATSTNVSLKVIDTIYNDLCSGAVVITNLNSTNTQSTSHASSFGDPLPACVDNFGNGVWYQLTPAINSLLVVDTFGSDFDTGLAIYSGSCGEMTPVDCNDDYDDLTSQVSVPTLAGTTYYILVGGYGGSAGNLVLHTHYFTAPAFDVQPTNLAVIVTSNATLSAVVSGAMPMSFQWYFNSNPLTDDGRILGSTNSTLNIAAVAVSDDGDYQLVASNFLGVSTSSVAHLLVLIPPSITVNPIGRSVPNLLPTTFNGAVTGNPAPTYQWRLNGTNIPGATSSSYGISFVGTNDLGFYTLVASNIAGTAVSSAAQLTFGPVAAWGRNLNNESLPPPGLSGVMAISGNSGAGFAVRTNGTIVKWGGGSGVNSTNIPTSATNVVAISTFGTSVSLALRANGTVVGWNGPAVPQLSNIVAVAAGNGFGYALRAEGTVTNWGSGSTLNFPPGLNHVVSIAAGGNNALALRSDGTVTVAGVGVVANIPAGATNVVAIAMGDTFALALRADGNVVAWGSGVGTNVPADLKTNIIAISAANNLGESFALALRGDGTVGGWGVSPNGETIPPDALRFKAYNVSSVAIDAAPFHGLSLVGDGSPLIIQPPVGLTTYMGRDLSLPARAIGAAPLSYQWLRNGTNISGATNMNLLVPNIQLTDTANYQLFVSNALGTALSLAAPVNVISNRTLTILAQNTTGGTNYQGAKISIGGVAVLGNGPLSYQWFFSVTNRNYAVVPGATNDTLTMDPALAGQSGNYYVAVSNLVSGVTTAPVAVKVLFAKAFGYLATDAPFVLSNAVQVAVGNQGQGTSLGHYLALRSDGKISPWGSSTFGATNVNALSNSIVTAVAAGNGHSLALKSDGTVYAWGTGDQAGGGITNVPAGLNGVTAIACGDSHDVALKPDGTIVSWGSNTYGQVTNTGAASNVVAIAAGIRHTLVLRADGTVGSIGNFGISDGANIIPPSATNVIAVAAGCGSTSGSGFSVALRANGSVVQWGTGIAQFSIPPNLSNVVAIAAGAQHVTALRNDGTVTSWGLEAGGLAVNNLPSNTLANVIAVSSSGDHDVALFGTRAPAFTVQPWSRTISISPQTGATNFLLVGKAAGVQPMSYQWRLNGTNIAGATNDNLMVRLDPGNRTLPGGGAYQLICGNAYGTITSRTAKISVQIPLSDALDAPAFAWLSTNGAPWFGQTNFTHDGIDAARSGGIGPSSETIMQTTIVTNFSGSAKFWWKISSEQFFDTLEFRVNGVVLGSISGEADWQLASFAIPPGTNVFQWRYSKDPSFDSGLDAAFVDQFSFVVDPPTILDQPAGVVIRAGQSFTLSVNALGMPQLNYAWTKDGSLVNNQGPVLAIGNATPADAGNYRVTVTNLAGATISSIALVRVVTPQLLGTPQLLPDGSLQLTSTAGNPLTEDDLPNFEAQASTDLVNWETLPDALSIRNGALLLNDTESSNYTTRFYRIVEH